MVKTIAKTINGTYTKFIFRRENENYIYIAIETKYSWGLKRFPKTHCKNLQECVEFYMKHKGNLSEVLRKLRKK